MSQLPARVRRVTVNVKLINADGFCEWDKPSEDRWRSNVTLARRHFNLQNTQVTAG